MRTVGSHEVKTHLAQILREVAKGETFVITNRGIPVARLIPEPADSKSDLKAVVERIRRARASRPKVTLEEILEMRDEGRRY